MSTQDFEDNRWTTTPQKKEFRHTTALELTPLGTVLDVGCGDGLLLEMYAEKDIRAEGVDISNVAVEVCHKKGFTATKNDFTSEPLPFGDGSFDTVVALDVLEHVYSPEKVLSEMNRVAKTSIVISVPNFGSLPARIQVLLGRVPENNAPNKGHLYWFTWKVLTELLAQEHLVIEEGRFNTTWEQVPVLGLITKALARMYPSMFALSFVVRCRKQ
jgi:methionine biosynthesis protein MetW